MMNLGQNFMTNLYIYFDFSFFLTVNEIGKRCQTLRRLAFQKKLIEEEINLLTEMGFRFNTLEEVYEEADFDDCLQRLIK